MCWEVCVLLIESGEFCYFLWKCRTCLTCYWHSAPFFFIFESKKVLGSAEPSLHLQLVSCRTKSASSVCLLQNQDYVFISAAAEPRHLQFVLCRAKATALFSCLQNLRQCLHFVFCGTNTTSSFCLLQNQDCLQFVLFILHSPKQRVLLEECKFLSDSKSSAHFVEREVLSPSA